MTGTTKTPRRKPAAPKKAAAKPAATKKTVAAKTKSGSAPAKKPAPVKEPEVVAELTAADIANASKSTADTVVEAVEKVEIPEPVEAAAETITEVTDSIDEKGTEIMSDVIETTKKYTEEAKERFQSAFAEMSEKTKASVEKSTKAFEEMSDLAKGNVEALVESGKIASKGMESMGHDAAEYGRVSFEKASAAMKSFAAVKSPTEFFQLQSELMSSVFDAFAKESAKNSEAMLKLAGDVAQPISTRVSVMTEKVRGIAA